MSRRPWDEDKWTRAQAMRRYGKSFRAIAAALGRGEEAVRRKFNREAELAEARRRLPAPAETARDDRLLPDRLASPAAVTERARRANLAPRDLTAALFGDPLPGYSALERGAGEREKRRPYLG